MIPFRHQNARGFFARWRAHPSEELGSLTSDQQQPHHLQHSPWPEMVVVVVASTISIISYIYFRTNGLTLIHGDAMSHLNIARRVVDNITPGLAHLGSIWLPLQHLLMLPVIWIDPFYRTGLAGSMVSMLAFIASAFFIFATVKEVTKDMWAGVVGTSAFMLNPSMLYIQSTPMTEPLMIGTSVMALYFLTKWSRSLQHQYLYATAIAVFLATLSRYDGWFYIPTMAACIMLVGIMTKGPNASEAWLLAFLAPATYGVFLWLFYNWLIFGDPLSFVTSMGTATWDAQSIIAAGAISPKWNLGLSIEIYWWTMLDVVGPLGFLLLISGILLYAGKSRFHSALLPGYVFLSPILFNILSLFLGQSLIISEHLPPYSSGFNVRYGLMALPSVAFFSGYISSGHWWKKTVLIIAIVAQAYAFWPPQMIPIVTEPLVQTSASIQKATYVSQILMQTYNGEKILISSLANDVLIFTLALPLKNIIYEGNHPYWDISLQHPGTYASWIITNTTGGRDQLTVAFATNQELASEFDLVYENDMYRLYRNKHSVEAIP